MENISSQDNRQGAQAQDRIQKVFCYQRMEKRSTDRKQKAKDKIETGKQN
jgi:hypothetical protein